MAKGISLHIGMEYIDPDYYDGDDGALRTCAQDMLDMEAIAMSQSFDTIKLLQNENATREAVKEAIISASQELEAGDMFLITYSGHGTIVEDEDGDEEGNDESWCLYNGLLLDDELHVLWKGFDEDVRIFMVSDSCHSGTIAKVAPGMSLDTMPVPKFLSPITAKKVYRKNKEFYDAIRKEVALSADKVLNASVKLIAGCQDDESSYILPESENSVLTDELKKIWNSGQFTGTTEEFFETIKVKVMEVAEENRFYQTPNLYTIGKENAAFDEQRPFKI